MKILFIFTGGTIGSTQNKELISADPKKSYKIIKAYQEKFGIDFEYDTIEPYIELSENNTGKHVRELIKATCQNLNKGYDGIIVTHGTDTIQYSSAAIGYAIGLDTIPVCIVSSNFPIEHEQSNGLDNLHGAIKLIEQKLFRGALVVYRNDVGGEVEIHRATRLLSSLPFSDDIESAFDISLGKFDTSFSFIKNETYREESDAIAPLAAKNLDEESEGILRISPYTGMTYPKITSDIKYVIIDTYHSGTINTKSQDAIDFFKLAKEMNVTIFVAGVTEGPTYDSTKSYSDYDFVLIKNVSPIAAYVKLWLLKSCGICPIENVNKSLSGDIIIL